MTSKWLLGLFIFSTCFASYSPNVLYGEDDRLDLFQVTNTDSKNQARSVAAIVLKFFRVKFFLLFLITK